MNKTIISALALGLAIAAIAGAGTTQKDTSKQDATVCSCCPPECPTGSGCCCGGGCCK